jgi:hypothetical protein
MLCLTTEADMATRAEKFRSEQSRHGAKSARTSAKKPKKSQWSRDSKHAGAKATRALEQTAPGRRPSRESSRGGANRAKPGAPMDLKEQKRRGSPENRARRSLARGMKVRGKGR